MSSPLRPALVIGSGFHRYVFSSGDADRPSSRACLCNWHTLIDETADSMQVARPNRALNPTMRWEEMISIALQYGYRTVNGTFRLPKQDVASRIEAFARRHAAKALEAASCNYHQSERARFPSKSAWGCVISLNFDISWHPFYSARHKLLMQNVSPFSEDKALSLSERRRLHASLPPSDKAPRVWFPNGSVLEPKSIRMGLRDYGAASFAIHLEFQRLKAWEQNFLGPKNLRSKEGFESIAAILDEQKGDDEKTIKAFPYSWVAEFMYRPVVFAGVGLSEQETGLWWLLNQRARNVARVEGGLGNNVHILVHHDDRHDFWSVNPCGIKPIFCKHWDQGWSDILNLAMK